jgi:hypothetical protein
MSEDTQVLEPETESMETESVETEEIFQEYEVDMNAASEDEVESSENEVPTLLRTAADGCFEVYEGYWGKYIRPCFDPEANVEITKEHLEHFELNPNIHKVPAELWTRWVNLCFHFVDKVKSSVEVSVRILRSEEDPSKYRILVPKQVVSGAAVRVDSFDESIDIETGEELTQYPPVGWIPVGSSHSHNTMPAFFSGTDDKYELGDPGIHLVVGGIKTKERQYEIAASVVGSGRRFKMSYKDLIDATAVDNVTFHPKVVEYVDYESPVYTNTYTQYNKGTALAKSNYSYSNSDVYNYGKWLEQYSSYSYTNNNQYKDPFYYNGTYTGTSKEVKLWEVEDITVDLIKQSQHDINRLFTILDFLQGTAKDVEGMIGDMLYNSGC